MWLEVCVELWRCGCRVVCLDGELSRAVLDRLVGALSELRVVGWQTLWSRATCSTWIYCGYCFVDGVLSMLSWIVIMSGVPRSAAWSLDCRRID